MRTALLILILTLLIGFFGWRELLAREWEQTLVDVGVPRTCIREQRPRTEEAARDTATMCLIADLVARGVNAETIATVNLQPQTAAEANAFAIPYFQQDLAQRGVDLTVVSTEPQPTSLKGSIYVARNYFMELLVERGLPEAHAQLHVVQLTDRTTVDGLTRDYLRDDLIARGLTAEDIQLLSPLPLTLAEAETMVQEYLSAELVAQQVEMWFIDQYQHLLISRPVAEQIFGLWEEEQA